MSPSDVGVVSSALLKVQKHRNSGTSMRCSSSRIQFPRFDTEYFPVRYLQTFVELQNQRSVQTHWRTSERSAHTIAKDPMVSHPAVALIGNIEHTTLNATEFATPRLVPITLSGGSLISLVMSFWVQELRQHVCSIIF